MSAYRTKYHRDGTVTVWDVYQQQWTRRLPSDLIAERVRSNAVLPTMPDGDRDRITRMAAES